MHSGYWTNCRSCDRRMNNIGDDGLCATCHNKIIDEREQQRPAHPPRPRWCGQCEERTRQIEVARAPALVAAGYSEMIIARCPRCHPLVTRHLRTVA